MFRNKGVRDYETINYKTVDRALMLKEVAKKIQDSVEFEIAHVRDTKI